MSEWTLILTDAPINPGNSGGPLVDACGSVIGMNMAGVAAVDVEGINWAVAESTIRERYDILMQGSLPGNEPEPTAQPSAEADWVPFEGERFEGPYTGAGTRGENDPFNNELLIRCTNNIELEAFVVLGGSYMSNFGLIEIRFSGQDDVLGDLATPSTDNEALFVDDVEEFITQLRDNQIASERLFMRLWTYYDPGDIDNSSTYHGEATFGIVGFDEVVEPVLEACGWVTSMK